MIAVLHCCQYRVLHVLCSQSRVCADLVLQQEQGLEQGLEQGSPPQAAQPGLEDFAVTQVEGGPIDIDYRALDITFTGSVDLKVGKFKADAELVRGHLFKEADAVKIGCDVFKIVNGELVKAVVEGTVGGTIIAETTTPSKAEAASFFAVRDAQAAAAAAARRSAAEPNSDDERDLRRNQKLEARSARAALRATQRGGAEASTVQATVRPPRRAVVAPTLKPLWQVEWDDDIYVPEGYFKTAVVSTIMIAAFTVTLTALAHRC
jgi:hypothetical protein